MLEHFVSCTLKWGPVFFSLKILNGGAPGEAQYSAGVGGGEHTCTPRPPSPSSYTTDYNRMFNFSMVFHGQFCYKYQSSVFRMKYYSKTNLCLKYLLTPLTVLVSYFENLLSFFLLKCFLLKCYLLSFHSVFFTNINLFTG